jgi:hypothetical protein
MPQDDAHRARAAWIPLTALLITAALYGRSLHLPFYSDDLVQLAWLRGLTFGELWGRVSPYGYYRPLAFSLWIGWRDLGLPLTPAGLRLLNLAGHALAAALVGRLVATLDAKQRSLSGVFAAAIFAAYPFAYQAVPWVSAIFYPLVVILSVGAVLAYRRFRTGTARRSPLLLVASVALAGLAPFAHENGMLAGLLVALFELVGWLAHRGEGRGRSPSPWPLLHIGLNAAFMIAWFRVRPGGVATLDLSLAGLARNATMLASGLAFPLAPLAVLLARVGVPLALGVWVIALAAVGLLVWPTRRTWPLAAVSAGWFVLSVGPPLATMRPDWLADAPRFLYPAAVGAAVWWGVALSRVGADPEPARPVGRWARYAAPLLALAAIAPGAYFAHRGIGWHLRGAEAIRDAVAAARADPGAPLLLVNLPNRLSPQTGFYPYFDGGAILLPPQVPAGEIAGAHLGGNRPGDRAATVGAILPPVTYRRVTYGDPPGVGALGDLIGDGHRVYVADYGGEAIRLRYAGMLVDDPPPGEVIARFGSSLALRGTESGIEGSVLRLALMWELTGPLEGAPTMFVHLVGADGAPVAQADGDPLLGLYPLQAWPVGSVVEDVRYITLPGEGPYQVYVGVWGPETGRRLAATDADGRRCPDDRVPVGP